MLKLSHDLGIDLGTANTLVCLKGKGVVVSEPSVVAVNNENGDITAVGNDARNMIGRTPGNITVVRQMKDGIIANYDTTATMLKYNIKKAKSKQSFYNTNINMSLYVQTGITKEKEK